MLQQMGGYTNKGIKFVIISEKIWITEKNKLSICMENTDSNMYGHRICMEKTDSNISMQRLSREYSNNLIRAWLNEEDQRKRSIKPLKKIKS
jgi:hypothetical protein